MVQNATVKLPFALHRKLLGISSNTHELFWNWGTKLYTLQSIN